MCRRRQVHLSIVSEIQSQKYLRAYTTARGALEAPFPKLKTFSKSAKPLSRNRDPNMTKNEHVYAICSRQNIAGGVISGRNVKTIEGYGELKFEVAIALVVSEIFQKDNFVTLKLAMYYERERDFQTTSSS